MKHLLIAVALFFFSGPLMAQRQGICGRVEWVEGNQMPGTTTRKPAKGVEREIYIYEPVNRQNLKLVDGLYQSVPGTPIKIVKSASDGSFEARLPPGTYSIFVKEPGGYFANIFNAEGIANPVTVNKRKYTTTQIRINYKAAY